jgi:hypothetical protein
MHRIRNTRCSKPPTTSPAAYKGNKYRESTKSPISTPQENIHNWESEQVASKGWIKPTSRPKRKCRFGPRARRTLHRQGTQSHNPPQLRATPTVESPTDPPYPSHINSPPPIIPPRKDPFVNQTYPDRVTFQPVIRPRRTPFDHYKKDKGTWRGAEVNTAKIVAKRLGIPKIEFGELLTREINELLDEIETTRLAALNGKGKDKEQASHHSEETRQDSPQLTRDTITTEYPNPSQTDHLQGDSHPKERDKINSRPLERSGRRIKEKCHFGPRSKRGREKLRTSPPSRRDPPPPPPSCRTTLKDKVGQGRLLFGDGQRQPFTGDWTCRAAGDPDRLLPTSAPHCDPQVHQSQEEEDIQVVLPDRPTFFHYIPARRTPFMRYSKTPILEDRPPPPFRPVHVRLGISEEEFEAGLKLEIDSVLEESCRRVTDPEEASPSTPIPPLTVMTKENGLRFFRNREFPTTGPLLGVWWWAADLGWSRFDYESDVNWDDLSFLNAYD